ncbi:flagellar protein FlaG [Asticcacaulis sp. BE141]|nr:flagellar protein FlaG [Asticcacaulis sp. BE141]MBP2158916.1 flagellar protein FlaG [Asticcacaulis solisilvae]MDR6799961.1 flagellar protein FlaG [Asticcacaulis sp. BE141]
MINNVVSFPQPDPSQVRVPVALPKEVAPLQPSGKSRDAGNQSNLSQDGKSTPEYNLRLTVDKDPDSGDWVYKALDRYTGEVVRQFPRQEVLDLKASRNYKAGTIIKTDV